MKRKYRSDTTEELQAQLKGLVMKMLALESVSWDDTLRYEELLAELYLRGVEPAATLKPTGRKS